MNETLISQKGGEKKLKKKDSFKFFILFDSNNNQTKVDVIFVNM